MNRTSMWRVPVAAAVIAVLALALAPQGAAAQEPDGAAIYKQSCQSCHGPKGAPSQRMATMYPEMKNLSDSAFMNTLSADSIATILRNGVGRKKSFAGKLTDAQMLAVAQYVKTLPSLPPTP